MSKSEIASKIFNIIYELTPIFALAGILFQIFLQNRSNLKLQKENTRQELKLEIFEKFQKTISDYIEHNSSYSYTLSMKFSLLNLYDQIQHIGIQNLLPIPYTYDNFLKLRVEFEDAVLNIVFFVERWEIVDPKFMVFRLAIISASHDFRAAFIDLHPHLMQALPIKHKNQNNEEITVWPNIPNHEYIVNTLIPLTDKYLFYFDAITGYIHDLQIEFQNILLGNLFENNIEYRKPLDPKCIAIDFTKKSISEWIKYFEEETNWGKNSKLSQDVVKQRVENER